ncbi:MAG: polyribonucleotide nucleotidyltransferase, partial [Bacillota bacterium]|nr:polyribonucleotide nucleotidyltransferase [Bacillota bacterium]
MKAHVFRTEVAGRPLQIEHGALAGQANGAVLVRYGDTTVLVTATATREPREDVDFFPLRVDYEERQYAAGRIPGSFFRREGRPSERAVLNARLIDRPIRPLFPKGFFHDVQVVATVLSFDPDNGPDIASIIGASVALSISDIPFGGPVGAVMMGLVDGELVVNPTEAQLAQSRLELAVAGTKDAIIMVEAGADEVPEETILEALQKGHEVIKELCAWQETIVAQVGKPKMSFTPPQLDEGLVQEVGLWAQERLEAALLAGTKEERESLRDQVKKEALERFSETYPQQEKAIGQVLHDVERDVMRRLILERGLRADGRGPKDIRPIWCDAGFLPRAHGSGLFTRGETQVLSVATLGAASDRQLIDSLGDEPFRRYMHHYNFPPYSTGEVKPMRSPGRREIGHGALAERALLPMIPSEEEFPYTIRVV